MPWEGGGKGKPVQVGPLKTQNEIAKSITDKITSALEWNKSNSDAGKANAVIIYAWNEFDEGGWICPTISEGTNRLDAIRAALIGPNKIINPSKNP